MATAARLWRFYHTPEGTKLFRYGMVSVVSALIGFSILTLVYGVLQLWTEVPSALFSNILATIPNYYLNRRWVWGKSGRSHLWREIIPFWVMSISGMILALLTASLARSFSNAHDLGHVTRTIVIVGANTAAFGIIWILKFLVLNRLFQHLPVAESDQELSSTWPAEAADSSGGLLAPPTATRSVQAERLETPQQSLSTGDSE